MSGWELSMNVRVAIAPFALALVVITPAIVDTATEPDTPKPPESTLTISVSDSTETIRLVNAGEPTEGVSTPLVDASGDTVSEIRVVEPNDTADATCASAPVHDTGRRAADGTSVTTCLQLSGLEPATSVSGTITGTGVTLTTNYPRGMTWFAFFALLGIAVALLLLWLAGLLKRLAGSVVLDDLLDRNESAGANRIEGLRRWAARMSDLGQDDDAIKAKVHEALRTVPGRARLVRHDLQSAADELGDDLALRTTLVDASRKPITIDDYHRATGEAIDPSPLLKPIGLIAPLLSALEKLDAMDAELEQVDAESPQKSSAEAAVARARTSARAVVAEGDLATLRVLVRTARQTVRRVTTGDHQPVLHAVDPDIDLAMAVSTETPFSVSTVDRIRAWSLFAVYLAVIASLALAALYLSNYSNKAAFGTGDDLLALFVAATGSAAAGSIAVAVGWWRVEETKA